MLRRFVLFAGNGVVTAVVYTVAAWSLVWRFPDAFVADVVVAYAVALIVNFVGARYVFSPETTFATHGWRYLCVAGANFLVTTGLAWAAHRWGLPDPVAVYGPVLVTTVPTFVVMQRWVFT